MIISDNFFQLIAIAMFIEAIITYSKTIYDKKKIQWQVVVALAVALVFCYDMNLNFFISLGLEEKYPIIGTAATAIILSRGSNYMFEFYNQLNGWREKNTGEDFE